MVHPQLHPGDVIVKTSACNSRCYQHLNVPDLKQGLAGHPLLLLPCTVQGGGGDADLGKEVDPSQLCCTIVPAEDNGGISNIFCFLVQQELDEVSI